MTDAFDDRGIDAIYYEASEHRLVLVQSNWHKDDKGNIDQGDALKLKAGIELLLQGDLSTFNAKLRSHQEEIIQALEDGSTSVVVVAAHTGTQPMSPEVRKVLDELVAELNDPSDVHSVKHSFPIAPNLLERNLTAMVPDRAWVTDITFLWTAQGWLYLAVILDLFSRRVVGWATSRNVDRYLALAALTSACPPLVSRSQDRRTVSGCDADGGGGGRGIGSIARSAATRPVRVVGVRTAWSKSDQVDDARGNFVRRERAAHMVVDSEASAQRSGRSGPPHFSPGLGPVPRRLTAR